MAKTSKKALGAAMAGVMAVGAVAGAVNAVQEVKAGVAEDVQVIHAKIEHFRTSLKKNYLGLKNVAQWQAYEKELKVLIGKLPAGSTQDKYKARLDVCVSLLNAAAKVNHVEKSLVDNFNGIKNAEVWSVYLKDGNDLLGKVDKEFEGRKAELVERLAKAKTTVDGIIKKHETDLAEATKLYEAAKVSKKLADANNALAAAKKLGTHSSSAELVSKCESLIAELGNKVAVTGIQALNLKEIKVSFNKPVDITNMTNVITEVGSASAPGTLTVTLSDDKTSVIIASSSNLTMDGFYNVVITNAVDKDTKEVIKPYSAAVKIEDKVAPTVASMKAVTTATVTRSVSVTFSEPVTFGLVKIGDDIATATNPTGDQKNWVFALANSSAKDLEVGKSYEVSIAGLADLAGNYAANPLKQSVTVVRDEVKPQYTIKAINPRQFDIVFDKEMSSSVAFDSVVVKDVNSTVLSQANLAVRDAVDKKVFHVTLATSPIAADKASAEVSVTVKGLQDLVGNIVSTKTDKVTLSKETVKPEMTSVRTIPGQANKVEVTFSEAVSGIEKEDFKLTDSKNQAITISSVSGLDSDNRVVLTTSALANDTYNLALVVGSVVDASGNTNDAKAIKFTYNGAVAPQLVATFVESGLATDANSIKVEFNRTDVVNGIDNLTGNYKSGSADNKANYTINGLALPQGATVSFTDNAASGNADNKDYITISFANVAVKDMPTALVEGGAIVLTASGVKTEAGATLAYTSNKLTVVDKKAPEVIGAFLTKVGAGYKLSVQLSEEVTGTAVADKFTVNAKKVATNDAAVLADKTVVVNKNVVEISFTSADISLVKAITLDIVAANGVKDLANVDLAAKSDIAVTNYAQ